MTNLNTSIPEGFDNSRYDICSGLNYERWRTALITRINLNDEINQFLSVGKEFFLHDLARQSLQSKVHNLLDSPIPTKDVKTRFTNLPLKPIENRKIVDDLISNRKLADNGYQQSLQQEMERWCNSIIDDQDNPKFRVLGPDRAFRESEFKRLSWYFIETISAREIDKKTLGSSNDFHVKINLSFPDDEIIAELKEWLRATRRTEKLSAPKHQITDRDLRKWSYYRVIPYIDLLLYQKAFEVDFTWKCIAEALFGNNPEFDSLSKTRNTTHDLATTLLQQVYYDSMRYSNKDNVA